MLTIVSLRSLESQNELLLDPLVVGFVGFELGKRDAEILEQRNLA